MLQVRRKAGKAETTEYYCSLGRSIGWWDLCRGSGGTFHRGEEQRRQRYGYNFPNNLPTALPDSSRLLLSYLPETSKDQGLVVEYTQQITRLLYDGKG